MLYDQPKFLIGGDSFITIELGDEGSLRMNLYVLSMERMIWDSKIEGLIDTTSLRTTIMIHYNPFIVQADQIIEQIRHIYKRGITIPPNISSRIIYLPVYYNDPCTRECAVQHGVKPNLEIIAKDNNMTPQEVIEAHSQPTYFVSYTSFMYGSFGAFPINPITTLVTSKYKTPRKWTPAGSLGIGGNTTAFYSVSSPGGIMMLGNIPVRTFDLDSRNPFFKDNPLLINPGDQLRFIPIEDTEYNYIKNHKNEYQYKIEKTLIETENV